MKEWWSTPREENDEENGKAVWPMPCVADPDPGSGALTPGSGIRSRFFPDPGSRIPNPYILEHIENLLGKNFNNSLKIGPNFFL